MAEKKFDANAFEADQTEATVASTRRLRAAIIGCGCIANDHWGSYRRQPDVDVVALCDIVPGRCTLNKHSHRLRDK